MQAQWAHHDGHFLCSPWASGQPLIGEVPYCTRHAASGQKNSLKSPADRCFADTLRPFRRTHVLAGAPIPRGRLSDGGMFVGYEPMGFWRYCLTSAGAPVSSSWPWARAPGHPLGFGLRLTVFLPAKGRLRVQTNFRNGRSPVVALHVRLSGREVPQPGSHQPPGHRSSNDGFRCDPAAQSGPQPVARRPASTRNVRGAHSTYAQANGLRPRPVGQQSRCQSERENPGNRGSPPACQRPAYTGHARIGICRPAESVDRVGEDRHLPARV